MSFKQLKIPPTLITAAQRGDGAALEKVLKAFEPLAFYTALSFLHDPESARDAAQEALLKIALHISAFEARSKFSTWAYRIIRNCVSDSLRKRKEPSLELTDENAGFSPNETDREAQNNETWLMITKSLEILSPEKQEIIVLFELQGYSFREISELLDIPEGSVKSKWSRAK
ncbi:sigma-70 family RNA polymerase sigma factor, partial [Myxococcota bacterium]|nr:sigma-70 family RNA polymerase sigma factor [Myxococcota bacterium]